MTKNITPQEAATLVQGLKQEVTHYNNAASDPAKAKEHLQKADRYKNLLIQYREQQKGQNPSFDDANVSLAISMVPSRPSTPFNAGAASNPSPNSSLEEKISRLKVRFQEVRARINSLEELKRKETNPERVAAYDLELAKLRPTFTKIANVLNTQRILSPAPDSRAQLPAPVRANSTSPPPTNYRQLPTPQLRVQPPRAAAIRAPTAILATRPVVPQQAISSSRVQGSNYYSLTTSLRQLPMYPVSDYYSGYQGDSLGRMLQKRKIQEVVSSLLVDEDPNVVNRAGNLVDGDVEDLLIDLADEFVTQVTSFACKLAKHRKVELIDTRDVQLNLERNWGIRVPGYTMDEIKTTRKWQLLGEHQEKKEHVEAAKKGEKK